MGPSGGCSSGRRGRRRPVKRMAAVVMAGKIKLRHVGVQVELVGVLIVL